MKKLGALGAAFALLGYGASAFAASGTAATVVAMALVDKLILSNGGTITLDDSAADPTTSGTLGPVTDVSARLSYIHNKNVPKKITVQATTFPVAAGNDIQLEILIQGGSYVTVYNDAGATAAQDALLGINAGVLTNQTVIYRARATAAGTPVGASTNFSFTITYTTIDN